MADAYRVTLIGGFSLHRSGQPIDLAIGPQRLIAYLAIHGRLATRSRVAGTLWPDTTEEHAMGSLRSALWRLGPSARGVIDGAGHHLGLAPGVDVDVWSMSETAHHVLAGIDPVDRSSVDDLAAAGEVLPDWSDDWIVVEREHFRQMRLHALERLCGRLVRTGDYGWAVEVGLAAVAGEPLRESAHRELIKVFLAEGNSAEAIRQYERCERLLLDELGVAPSDEMRALVVRFGVLAR